VRETGERARWMKKHRNEEGLRRHRERWRNSRTGGALEKSEVEIRDWRKWMRKYHERVLA
jgi:hypothetical protein